MAYWRGLRVVGWLGDRELHGTERAFVPIRRPHRTPPSTRPAPRGEPTQRVDKPRRAEGIIRNPEAKAVYFHHGGKPWKRSAKLTPAWLTDWSTPMAIGSTTAAQIRNNSPWPASGWNRRNR